MKRRTIPKKRIVLFIVAVLLFIFAVSGFVIISGNGEYYPVPLMYHLIMDEPYSEYESMFVGTADFNKHLDAIDKKGYEYYFADEFSPKAEHGIILTFDDGYEDNYTNMFPVLKEHNAKATVFLVCNLIGTEGYLSEGQIREMHDSGLVRFGSHTLNHCNLTEVSPEEAESEIKKSAAFLNELLGENSAVMSYPEGKYNDEIKSFASEYFDFIYTTDSKPGKMPDYSAIPRINVGRGLSDLKLMDRIRLLSFRLNR